jgi:protein-S-isoprenylcysteine O-methyltransferase Ste14
VPLLLDDPVAHWLLVAAVVAIARVPGLRTEYAGIFLIFAGFGLACGSRVGAAVALLVVFAGMLPRIPVEERALAQAFGADYTDYANSTARVLPHV